LNVFLQKKYIGAYLSTRPKTIAYSVGNIHYIYKVIATDNGKYVYENCLDDHYRSRFSSFSDEVALCKIICEHANDSKFFPGPRFIFFILSNRPVGDNVDFVKKKLVATIEQFLKNHDINMNKYSTLFLYERVLTDSRIEDYGEHPNDSSVVDDVLTNLTKISPQH
jgi:hypothetical protein